MGKVSVFLDPQKKTTVQFILHRCFISNTSSPARWCQNVPGDVSFENRFKAMCILYNLNDLNLPSALRRLIYKYLQSLVKVASFDI